MSAILLKRPSVPIGKEQLRQIEDPTLTFVEEKFKSNEVARQPHKARVKNAIDLSLLKTPTPDLHLINTLEKEGIHTVLRRNADELIYGITYVDYRTKCVFNGGDLGKEYSAKAIQKRCGQSSKLEVSRQQSPEPNELAGSNKTSSLQDSRGGSRNTTLDFTD